MDVNQWVAAAAERCARHPYIILTFALLLSVLSAWAVVHLPVYTSRQALLPKNSEVVRRLDTFLEKFGAASDLIVVVEGAPREELEAFAAELTSRLSEEPEIGQVNSRLDTAFLLNHAYLMAPSEWLDRLGAMMNGKPRHKTLGIDALLRQASDWVRQPPPMNDVDVQTAGKSLQSAALLVEEWRRWLVAENLPVDLDLGPLLARHDAAELARGDFASRDGRMLFIFVHPKDASEDFEVRGPFVDKVRSVVDDTRRRFREAGNPVPRVGLTGLPAAEYEEYVDIQRDIVLVIVTAIVLIALLILLVVRSFRWAVAIFVPMGLGALWSQALVLLTVGHLTIITSGFIAILFGLGADYGIFTSSRIAEERQAGRPLREAISVGIAASFGAVLTAGGASLAIFGALATVEFPGFAELGVVASEGVLLILLSTWIVQPALYALLPPRLQAAPVAAMGTTRGFGHGKAGAFPVPIALAVVTVAIGCAVLGSRYGFALPFDYDALSLLPKDSQAAHYERLMAAESDYQSEVVIFTAPGLAEARRITEAASQLDSIGRVQSLTHLFPLDAEARSRKAQALAVSSARAGYERELDGLQQKGLPPHAFERLRELLGITLEAIDQYQEQAFSAGHVALVKDLEELRRNVEAIRREFEQDAERARQRSEALLHRVLQMARQALAVVEGWDDARPLVPEQLPAALRERFFAPDGTVAIYAFPAKSVYDPANLEHLMRQVYSVSSTATGFPATSQAFSQSAVRSFTEGTRLAVAMCLVWLLLVLRNLKGFVLASLPLLIGGGWMLGIMAMAGITYNYANIIALPLVIALAADYGVWFSHRWRELRSHTPFQVTVIAGKVIALAAGTELAGLGAITLASYRGISTMGANITIGLLCCLAATLFVAPAIGQLIDPRRTK